MFLKYTESEIGGAFSTCAYLVFCFMDLLPETCATKMHHFLIIPAFR